MGEECPVAPTGPLRGTSVELLLPTVLEGLAIAELPEFIATQQFPENQLEPILTDWRLPEAGLYFVTPTARARPAKVSALADFLITELTDARWSAEAVMGWQPSAQRRKQPSGYPYRAHDYARCDLNARRISSANSFGCSNAAKCPPLSSSFQ
jgi:hypothetical protein